MRGAMTETAAYRVDHVFPPLPVRPRVLSVPKRLRGCLQREPEAVNAVWHSFLCSVEAALRQHSPDAGPQARLGAVSGLHRFGYAALYPHFHCGVLDGVFEAAQDADGEARFREAVGLSAQAMAAVQGQVRRRALRGCVRRGGPCNAGPMAEASSSMPRFALRTGTKTGESDSSATVP
jgi:hypothetical protein